MLVRVFEAEEMATALKMVKETLGPDALILSTRTLRKGGLGIFGKPVLEVTAAVEAPAARFLPQPAPIAPGKSAFAATDASSEPEINYRDLWRRNNVVAASTPRAERVAAPRAELAPVFVPVPVPDLPGENLTAMRAEIDELKGMIRQVAQGSRAEKNSSFAQVYSLAGESGGLQNLLGQMTRWGIEADAAETIARCAQEKLTASQLDDPRQLQKFFQETFGAMVRVTGSIFTGNRQEQQRIALVGPTGVGKTTTLAKLAADYLSHCDGKVALVTIDTYRIAAVEQLKVYGEIMYLPVEVVFSPAELQAAFARHADKDLILIDTAGRSPRDEFRLDELATFLGAESGTSNHLVLAAPTSNRELQETVRRFGRLALDSVIFTKLDECEDRGALLNVPVRQNLPVSYITNGQRVPEDLLAALPASIADFVMGHA